MVGRFVSRLSAIVAFVVMAAGAAAQTGTISGKVTDAATGRPIAGANVQVVAGARTAGTAAASEDGSYRVTGLPPGTYAVAASKVGYTLKRAENVTVSGGAPVTVNFAMTEISTLLNPVVTTATRGASAEKILDAPASISVVSSERISQKPAATIADFMKTIPGLSVSTAGLVQSNTVSRGFNNAFSGAMLNLQDYRFSGVPSLRVNVPFLYTGTSDDIERIEVLNGPAAALYGPNAANGVMHIITKSPLQSPGTTISLDGGGRALFRGAARTAWVLDDKKEWGIKLSGEYLSGTDWPYADPNQPAVFPSTAPAGRAGQPNVRDLLVKHYGGELRLDYRAADRDLENILTAGQTTMASAIEITTAFGPAQAKNWSYQSFQDRFRYKKFFAQVFYNNNNSGNKDSLDLTGSYFIQTGKAVVDNSSVLVGQLQQGFDLLDAKMVVGADYIATNPKSKGTIFGRYESTSNFGNTDITEVGAYLQGTVPLTPTLDLVGALRGDQTNRLAGSQASPRVAFVYKHDAENNFRFTFSRAFNSPASFEYFLDQVSNPAQAPGFALRAVGNPSKTGWQFNRSCDATINAGLCMHSPWTASATTPIASSAANAFPGFITALPSIVNSLPTLSAGQKAQLTALLGTGPGGIGAILNALRPTPAQLGTVLNLNGTIAPSAVTDIGPLQASFNNTWEFGYKGILGEKLRVAVDLWYQIRGDVGQPIGQANPLVLYDPTSLTTYLVTNITGGLVAAGLPQAQASATAAAAAGALVPLMAALPQGTLAFKNGLNNDQSIIATYQNGSGEIDVHGMDVALDYQMNDNWMLSATYSSQDKIVFPEIGGLTNPLMSNSAKNRGSVTTRYNNDGSGVGFDMTVRYTDAFPVNSGYYNSLTPNIFNASYATYPSVPAQTAVDLGISYRLPIQQKVSWSLNVSNLLDNRQPTFPGTPPIGRLILTRLRYEF
ncbi:MAG: TonB-dependent receptor domain-containing protein [Gemmatimonadales bacterium]